MSLSDLDLILDKDPIIATYPVDFLASCPAQVEQMYRTYARTHIALGDTKEYVDTIFRWVGGSNQGAFIGAVVGDYGHGKTSFQVHVWDESSQRKVFSVPPFAWNSVSDMIKGTDAWIQYALGKTNPDLARGARKVFDEFREKSVREAAEKIAIDTGQDVEAVYRSLIAGQDAGLIESTEVDADRFLDYCALVTEIIKSAGYLGLLVLLDEPEVAARRLGNYRVSQILFDLANGLLQRQGNFGVFLSMPENFLAAAQASFAALPARLQARGCFPRLRDIYGSDFAQALWSRYVEEFDLGDQGSQIVSDEALQSIGQVGSSDRRDLSYGPRTVVSAFRRMVHNYKETGEQYTPDDFIGDCLDSEVLVSPDFPTRIREALNSPEASGVDKNILLTLAAFPNGLMLSQAEEMGISDTALQLARSGNLVYKRRNIIGLKALLKQEGQAPEEDELTNTLRDIAGEFAPNPASYAVARDAFIKYVLPMLFEPRQGQQLLGWSYCLNWAPRKDGSKICEMEGAFRQTVSDYPNRTVVVAVSDLRVSAADVLSSVRPDVAEDILAHFQIRWNAEDAVPERLIEVNDGDPSKRRPGMIRLVLDLAGEAIKHEKLEEILDRELLSPLGILYLVGEMGKRSLARDSDADWQATRGILLRDLLVCFFGNQAVRSQATEQIGQSVTGGAGDLLGSISKRILVSRYPKYSTLIRQPQWEKKVGDYIQVLKSLDVPLAAKRGREPWTASGETIARAFNTNWMSLVGAFKGFENLVAIRSIGRDQGQVEFRIHPLEQEIMDCITAEKPAGKVKIEGKECWWMPYEQIEDLIVASGYQPDELRLIVEIGKSRGTFEAGLHKGKQILYVRPLDLDQMKAQLREKLSSLEEEMEVFKSLPRYQSSFSIEEASKAIENLHDESEFESLVTRINKEFEQNHNRLPGYFDQLSEQLTSISNNAANTRQHLESLREVASIRSGQQKAASKWCADLNAYIVPNLKSEVQSICSDCDSIMQKVSRAKGEYQFSKTGSALDKVKQLLEGCSLADRLDSEIDQIRANAKTLVSRLREYEIWQTRLLPVSDRLHADLLELKSDDSHAAKATELLKELEGLWDDISHHLKTRNVMGLGSHGQYETKLKEIDERRHSYLSQLRRAFDDEKERANGLLNDLELSVEARCKEMFNPSDVQGCYDRLYDEAAGHILHSLAEAKDEIASQRQELLYARDILRTLSSEADDLLERLHTTSDSLDAGIEAITPTWVKENISGIRSDKGDIKGLVQGARDAIKASKVAIRQAEPSREGEPSDTAKSMLNLIPDGQAVNLKEIILKMMDQGRESGEVLNVSLDALVELFRKSKVQVKVERPRR